MAGEKVEGQGEETLEQKVARLEAENLQHKERQSGFDRTLKEVDEGRRLPKWAQDRGITSLDDPRLKDPPAKKEPEPKQEPVDLVKLLDPMSELSPEERAAKLDEYIRTASDSTVSRRSAERQAVDEKSALDALVGSIPESQRSLAKSFLNETPVNPATGRKDFAARATEFANLRQKDREDYVAELAAKAKENLNGEPPSTGGGGGSPKAGQERKRVDLDFITDPEERRQALADDLAQDLADARRKKYGQ